MRAHVTEYVKKALTLQGCTWILYSTKDHPRLYSAFLTLSKYSKHVSCTHASIDIYIFYVLLCKDFF